MPPQREAPLIGRNARLELTFDYRRGRTVLAHAHAHAYAEAPFPIGRTFEAGARTGMILASVGSGVFALDYLHQSIHVGTGARVMLLSQLALQVHPGPDAAGATLESRCEIAEDGELNVHCDPVIPFAGSKLAQRIDLRLAAGSRLYWSDALMSGRCAGGERWMFLAFRYELRLTIADSLKHLERYRIVPRDRRLQHLWIAGQTDYIGTTLVYDEVVCEQAAEAL